MMRMYGLDRGAAANVRPVQRMSVSYSVSLRKYVVCSAVHACAFVYLRMYFRCDSDKRAHRLCTDIWA